MTLRPRAQVALFAVAVFVPWHVARAAVHINIGSAQSGPGETVSVTVSLSAGGASVAATANDMTFDRTSLSLDPSACRINATIAKSLLVSTLPSGAVRIFVQAKTDNTPIPDGPLYTCPIAIASSALPGKKYPLRNSNQNAFSPTGAELSRVGGADGSVTVSLVLLPTPTRTGSPRPTSTPVPPTATATRTPAPVCTPPACRPSEVFFCPEQCPGGCGTQCATPTPTISCLGDCNLDGTVAINELLLLINITLGNVGFSGCSAGVGGSAVTIDTLLSAVNGAVQGCHQSPSMPLRFVLFDASDIDQADFVDATSAEIDVVQDVCSSSGTPALEPFTPTTINVTLANDETTDIHLQQYTIDTGPRTGLGVIERSLSTTVPATDEATIGIVLFDLNDKARVSPDVYGQPLTAIITFAGTDPHRIVQASVPYTVTFDNLDSCSLAASAHERS